MQRGVVVSYETIRAWCAKFGQAYANGLRRRQPRPGDKWHLDEVFVKINGTIHYLWRAVDQHGNVLDVLVQPRRNALAAKKFFRKLLKGLRYVPRVIVTDKLRSYAVAHRRGDALGRAPAIEIPEQPGGELPSTHPATRAGDEALQISRARATVPVGVQRHLAALPAPSAPAVGGRLPTGDGRPLRGLERDHRGGPRPPPERELGQGFPPEPTHNTRTIDPNHQAHQLT